MRNFKGAEVVEKCLPMKVGEKNAGQEWTSDDLPLPNPCQEELLYS